MGIGIQRLLVALLLAVASIAAASAAGPAFEGQWKKEFVVDKGVRNQDPRWELVLHFGPHGTFTYLSRSTTEVRLSNGSTKPVVEEVRITGTWSPGNDGHISMKPDRAPTDPERRALEMNLGYDPMLGKAIATPHFDGKLMRLSGLGRDRQLFFRKVN